MNRKSLPSTQKKPEGRTDEHLERLQDEVEADDKLQRSLAKRLRLKVKCDLFSVEALGVAIDITCLYVL